MLKLQANKRDTNKKSEKYLEEGNLPAVFYGKTTSSESICIPLSDFKKVWKEAGESTIIALETSDGELDALIHEVQVHPVSNEPLHVDFYVVDKGQMITVDVPLEFIGEAPGVTDQGGILVKVMHELEIEASPRNLPPHIDIDVTTLANLGDQITVGDIKLPEGVTTAVSPEDVIVLIDTPKEEVEEETTTEVDLSAIEVEEKGKKEEGEGEEGKEE